MPYICDIRSGNVNNVIEVDGKLFIEGQEYTPTTLAPIAFSQGPTGFSAGSTTVNTANLTQLCLPRTYTRGNSGVYPTVGAAGMFDTNRIACGQEVLGSFAYTAAQGRYYGLAGSATPATISSFDGNFRIVNYNVGSSLAAQTFYTGGAAYSAPGTLFLPAYNGRWIVVAAGSTPLNSGATADVKSALSVLTDSGAVTAIRAVGSKHISLPYIGTGTFTTDWVLATHTPWTSVSAQDVYQATAISAYRRDTGAEVVAPTTWLSMTGTVPVTNYDQAGCFPSNAIVDAPNNLCYFYLPVMGTAAMTVYISTVTGLNSSPSFSTAFTGYTTTANASTDLLTVASFDVPTFSRVRFTNSGGALPTGISAGVDYWTVRQSSSTSSIATSYANAIAGVTVDITAAGSGTNTMNVLQTLNIADFTYYTATADSSTELITVSTYDTPTFSRVRFTNLGGALPGGLSAGVDYWTVRQSGTTSKLATSYANAVSGTTIDISSNGSGTTTIYVYTLATTTGDANGIVNYPLQAISVTGRFVRSWVFSDAGVNYLTVGVYEPGTGTSTATTALNLYVYRLENKTTATFLQRVTVGDYGRVRTYITLDSTQKRMVVVYDDRIAYYTWNPSTNWTLQSSQSVQTQDVGVDSQGRVWVTTSTGTFIPEQPAGSSYQSLYVYEPSGSAVNITLDFSQGSYSFAGTPISSDLIVNAYDTTGARVAMSVTLARNTANFEFTGGAASVTVTTSTGGNTSVPISVFATGLLSCRAAPT